MAQALKDKPILHSFILPYYEAFNRLNMRRQYSMGELPLLTSEIEIHCRLYNFDEDKEFFMRAMTELDDEFLSHKADEHERDREEKERRARSAEQR